MKTGKKIVVVILSILIVLVSIVAYASSLLRLGVLNPSVYADFMPAINSYSSMYESFNQNLLEPLEDMEIPEELQGVPEYIFKTAIPKDEFSKTVGQTIGGGIGWLLYNHDDVEVPVMAFSQKLKDAIASDERIINSDTNIKEVLDAIVTQKVEVFAPKGDYEQNFRGYVYYYLTGGIQKFQDTYDYWVDVFFYYYGVRLSRITIISFAALLILFVALVLIAKEKRETPLRLAKVLCIIYGIVNTVIGIGLFSLPYIATVVSSLEKYAKYIGYAKTLLNSFGALAFVYALILFVAAIILGITAKKIENSRQEI